MKKKQDLDSPSPLEEIQLLVAKKDFVIHHNDYLKEIKAGDDLSDVPAIYLENLKTENVL